MSDDEADEELLALLRQSLGMEPKGGPGAPPNTRVLRDAEYIYDNAIDVAIDSTNTKAAATMIWNLMQVKQYSPKTWSEHNLHPKDKNEATINFIFTMDLLNFSFWPEEPGEAAFTVDYRENSWTGYWSLVAALQRALEEGIPITDPHFWHDENECTEEVLRNVFRSSNDTPIPLFDDRVRCLRQAANVLYKRFDCSFAKCIEEAAGSAAALVLLLVDNFEVLRDEARFEGARVRFYKRAQIIVADLWACFQGEGLGSFHDIDTITMFADYRIPQMLCNLGCLQYSPSLLSRITALEKIEPGHPWEIQLRGCTIWCVELIRRQILLKDPKANTNAILIDFFLYDTIKEKESSGDQLVPHHRTRSIWY